MHWGSYGFLADENIHPEVVSFLTAKNFSVLSVREAGLLGSPDAVIVDIAEKEGLVVLTHD